jgi:transcriptional regulator with XRE-family HTH domain
MVDRIKQIMEFYELTPASFAEQIGINRSNLTHLFSGRNQPSLDLAKKILHYYPEIKTEWLIMGVGEMLRNNEDRELGEKIQNEKNRHTGFSEPDLFNSYSAPTPKIITPPESFIPTLHQEKEQIIDSREVETTPEPPQTIADTQISKKTEPTPPCPVEKPKVTQIVFFYSDQSFEVFQPKN